MYAVLTRTQDSSTTEKKQSVTLAFTQSIAFFLFRLGVVQGSGQMHGQQLLPPTKISILISLWNHEPVVSSP